MQSRNVIKCLTVWVQATDKTFFLSVTVFNIMWLLMQTADTNEQGTAKLSQLFWQFKVQISNR